VSGKYGELWNENTVLTKKTKEFLAA
jgi:hypothetical protein